MLGSIAGDIIGSIYEFENKKPDYDFPLFTDECFFTDDTVLTAALADSILAGTSYKSKLFEYYNMYPECSYGSRFSDWIKRNETEPYNSYGNGSAMRVSPVGWAYNSLDEVITEAKKSAEISHNHPEGIKGAQAAAASIFLARTGNSKNEIKIYIENTFLYDLNFDLEDLRENYSFNETCQATVPQSIYTFLISDSFEDSIRKTIYIGGDSDTAACINGSIAEAFYGGVPDNILNEVFKKLDNHLSGVVRKFSGKYLQEIY